MNSFLKRQIVLVLIAHVASTLGSHETVDLFDGGHINLTNCSGATPDESPSMESGLRSTVFTVFNDLDEIFKHLLDFPLFYSVPKPAFKNIYKTAFDEDSKESFMGHPGTAKTTGESEAFDIAYEGLLSSTESENESKNEKTPDWPNLGQLLTTKRKRANRSRRTVDSIEPKPEKLPNVVLIRNKANKEFQQIGVALSEFIVLTAASGLTDAQGKLCDPNQLSIYNQLPNGTETDLLPVLNIYQNPHFLPGDVAKNEIALLEVINPNNLTHFYPSLATANNETLPTNCSTFTWNVPEKYFTHPGQEIPHLKRQDIILSDPAKCKQLFSSFNESNNYCSVTKDLHHSSVDQLGAPLICSGELYGFVGGTGMITKGLDLFTRISQYNIFIEENKQKTFKRYANSAWKAKELYYVKSNAENLKRYMNQLVTPPLIVCLVIGFLYF